MADPARPQTVAFGPLVIAGAAVIVLSCVLLLENGTNYIANRWTIVFVLAGVAVALWQPRGIPAVRHAARR